VSYDPSQPRDKNGEWTGGAGGAKPPEIAKRHLAALRRVGKTGSPAANAKVDSIAAQHLALAGSPEQMYANLAAAERFHEVDSAYKPPAHNTIGHSGIVPTTKEGRK
jgi:hypothetical protein